MDAPLCHSCDVPVGRQGDLCPLCKSDPLGLSDTDLGGFHVGPVVMRHGHAVWYRAQGPDRPLLIKALPVDPEVGFPEIKGMLEEIRFLRSHPHRRLPDVYDTGGSNRLVYGVYEYLDGVSLLVQIREAPLPTREAIPLVLQLAEAFLHLDSHGLLLRALTPRGILIDPSGEPRLMDISGMCLEKGSVLPPPAAREGEEGFRAPELFSRPRSAAPPVDVYILGSLLFYMIVGDFLFHTSQRKHTDSGVLDHIPSALATVLERALSRDPEDRYANVRELVSALEEANTLITQASQERKTRSQLS